MPAEYLALDPIFINTKILNSHSKVGSQRLVSSIIAKTNNFRGLIVLFLMFLRTQISFTFAIPYIKFLNINNYERLRDFNFKFARYNSGSFEKWVWATLVYFSTYVFCIMNLFHEMMYYYYFH